VTDQRATPSSAFETLVRWEDSGGTWEVLRRGPDGVTISLRTCTVGEEVDRLTTTDVDVVAHLGDRERSDD